MAGLFDHRPSESCEPQPPDGGVDVGASLGNDEHSRLELGDASGAAVVAQAGADTADKHVTFTIRSLTLSTYVPTFLFAVGTGAVSPFIALLARDLGASASVASLIVALMSLGGMAFHIPSGMLIAAWGEQLAMVCGTTVLAAVALVTALASSLVELGIASVFMGFSASLWQLGRQSYVSEQAPIELRGRALSLIAGSVRIGSFFGPFCGGLIVSTMGISGVFVFQAVLAGAASLVMIVTMRRAGKSMRPVQVGPASTCGAVVAVASSEWYSLVTAGSAMLCLSVLRSARTVLIPLVGVHVGFSRAALARLVGLANGFDAALFYPGGMVMDRLGRLWVCIPSLVVLTAGTAAIALADTRAWFIAATIVIGAGNGIGAGIIMTLGADLAPLGKRGVFLGIWRTVSDFGGVGGPGLLAVLTAASSLRVGALVVAAVGVLGTVVTVTCVQETLKKPPRHARILVGTASVSSECDDDERGVELAPAPASDTVPRVHDVDTGHEPRAARARANPL